jgi:hypothetical protein
MWNDLRKIAIGASDGHIEDQIESLIKRRILIAVRPRIGGRRAVDCGVGQSAKGPHIDVRLEVEEEDLL